LGLNGFDGQCAVGATDGYPTQLYQKIPAVVVRQPDIDEGEIEMAKPRSQQSLSCGQGLRYNMPVPLQQLAERSVAAGDFEGVRSSIIPAATREQWTT
jgi:hypothetical protein